ncbi:MAG: DUF4397 domain-containing protein [Anaerolineae bacterium]
MTSKKYLVLLFFALIALVPAITAFTSYALPANDSQVQVNPADAQIRIGNFAPFSEGDAAIRLSVNGTDQVDDFNYGWSTMHLPIDSGELTIEVHEAEGAEALLKTSTITLEAGKKYTLLFIGNGTDQPFDLELIEDEIITADPSAAAIAFGHFAPLSGNLTGTSIDVREDNGIIVRDNLVYGGFDPADTDQLTKTTTSYIITSASGAREFIDLQTFGYNQGDVQYLLLVGDGRNKRIRAYLYVNDGPGGFMTTDNDSAVFVSPAVAFANFYSDDDIKSVHFSFGSATTSILEWGQLSPSTEYPAGDYEITVRDPDGNVILSEQVSLGLSETVIYAITKNNTDGEPLLVPIFGDYLETGVVPPHIRFVHLAPFTSGAFATLDVRRDNGLIIEDDLGFGEAGDFRALAPRTYTFNYTTRDGDRILFDPDPINLENGDNVTVFLIGDGTSELIRVVVHVDGIGTISEKKWSSPLGKFSLAHFAPTGEGDATNTRISIDSGIVASGFGFGDFRPAETIISGQHRVDVYDEATGALLASRVVSINPSTTHSIILSGNNVTEPYHIAFYEQFDGEPVNPTEAMLRFGHFAIVPENGSILDGSQVKLVNNGTDLFSGLTYGEFEGDTVSKMPPSTYELTYVDANDKEIPENEFEVDLAGGDNYILFSVGDGERHPYGLFAMRADGSSGELLKDVEDTSATLYLPIMSASQD